MVAEAVKEDEKIIKEGMCSEFCKKKYWLHNQLEYQIIHLLTRKGFWVFPTTKHSDRKISGWLDHPKKTTCISLFLLDSTIGFWSSNYLLNSIYNYPFHWSSKNHRTSFIYYHHLPFVSPLLSIIYGSRK